MRNETLYEFLTAKFKERGMAIERMPELFGFSRSSLYRYMKGIIRMSPDVQAKFIRILNLDENDRQELSRLVGLSEFDSAMIASRYALDNFVFNKQLDKKGCVPIKFAYYESDTFLRTSEEIYESIQALSAAPESICKIRVINCLRSNIFASVESFLERIFENSRSVVVEHLLSFSEKNHLHNTNTLINIIPLLQNKGYSVYYSMLPFSDEYGALFGNSIIVEIQNVNAPKFFFFSYLDEGLSSCLVTSDKNVFAFGLSNYEAFKKSYSTALLEASSLDLFGSKIAELQENTNCYLLKPNCCYDRIPMSVYQHMIERLVSNDLMNVQKSLANSDDELNGGLQNILSVLEKRIASSFTNRHIDVYSKKGLAEFARTGRITDHLDFLPSFDIEERRAVLEYIRDRYCDPTDSFQLYLTEEEIFENGYIFMAYENVGILIEYNQAEFRQGQCSNLFIRNKMLADVITDYVQNHIPDNHAVSSEETVKFLDKLIESLE